MSSSSTPTLVVPETEQVPKAPTPAETSQNPITDAEKQPQPNPDAYSSPLAQLGQVRKNFLLLIFSIATFVDICNVSGVAVAVSQIARDINLEISQIVWIITSYSLCFAAFLLFAGRIADLYNTKRVFLVGFFVLGVLSLVTSFVTTNKYGFLVLRGLGGIFGSLTIPSAFRLCVAMFPNPEEQQKKLALLGLSGAIGNVLGLVIAGLCMLASYHWFFRVIAIIGIVFSIMTFFLLPNTPTTKVHGDGARWKRLDIVGVLLMMGALICFILALTNGPINGWGSAGFIAPFIISFPLFIGFFVWESRIPPKTAVLPSSVWKITNMTVASLAVMIGFPFWATSQLQYATYFQQVYGWTPIHVAAAIVPQGIMGLIIGAAIQVFPVILQKPRIFIPIGVVLIMVAEVLQVYSGGGAGWDYWRYCFPAFLIGSAGAVIAYMGSAINMLVYAPPEMAGVIGGWTNVLAQIGGAVTLAVQAGLNDPEDYADWHESGSRAFWFLFAWVAVLGLIYAIFYKEPMSPEEEHKAARARILKTKGETGV